MTYAKSFLKRKNIRKGRRVFPFSSLRHNISLLPNLFTLGNAFFGFCSIIQSAQGEFIVSAYFILLGALFDALDGRFARILGASSNLGLQLDSLSDAISFCLAPAFLMYAWELKRYGFIGLLICALFLIAGILRLARFNITSEKQTIYFLGIPTTLAGCFLATILINTNHIQLQAKHTLGLLILVGTLACLMVSKIPFPTFKQLHKKRILLACLFVTAFIVTMGLTKVLLFCFIFYFLITLQSLLQKALYKP